MATRLWFLLLTGELLLLLLSIHNSVVSTHILHLFVSVAEIPGHGRGPVDTSNPCLTTNWLTSVVRSGKVSEKSDNCPPEPTAVYFHCYV